MAEGRIESYTPEEFFYEHDKNCIKINFGRVAEEYLDRFDKIDKNDKPKLKKAGADLLKAIPVAWAKNRVAFFSDLLAEASGDKNAGMTIAGDVLLDLRSYYQKEIEGVELNGVEHPKKYLGDILFCMKAIRVYRNIARTKSCKKRGNLQEGLGTD